MRSLQESYGRVLRASSRKRWSDSWAILWQSRLSGSMLRRPTPPAAHTHWLEEHPENREALENRRLLFHRMTEAGFINYCTEWWHFAYGERMWAYAHHTAPRYGFCPECDFPEER